MSRDRKDWSRRDLLRAASLGALTLSAGQPAADAQEAQKARKTEDRNPNKSLPRRRLGRTNMMVTVIGAGGAGISSPEILDRAIERGVNYVDTAPAYGDSEAVFGEVMRSRRKHVFLATKWYCMADWTAEQCLASLNHSLKTLQTEQVDLLLLHSVDADRRDPQSPEDGFRRIDNPGLHKAIEMARKQGKARYFGVSSHNARRKELLMHAIDTGVFDALLVAFNYGNYERSGMPELLEYAKKHDVGVIGMKAAQGNIAVPNVKPLSAQLAWVLSKDIHTVINSSVCQNEASQDTALAAAKVKIAQADLDTLETYASAVNELYCRGCSHLCESACPATVRIADILRFDMYYHHYGGKHRNLAHAAYAELTPEQRVLAQCADCRKCEEACPYDLPIVNRLHELDQTLA